MQYGLQSPSERYRCEPRHDLMSVPGLLMFYIRLVGLVCYSPPLEGLSSSLSATPQSCLLNSGKIIHVQDIDSEQSFAEQRLQLGAWLDLFWRPFWKTISCCIEGDFMDAFKHRS